MSLYSLIKGFIKRKPPTCTAVIAAAGLSQRCRGEDKLFYNINDKPVLAYTLEAFQKCDLVDDIIVVAQEGHYERIAEICSKYDIKKVSKIMKGGPTRPESVMNGVYAASRQTSLIAIHDGARPCVDREIIEKTIQAAAKYHAAAPAVSITSTIKKVDGDIISRTVDRDGMYEIQTPQVFRAEIIKGALTNAIRKSIDITDDCMAVEIIGLPVHITEGSRSNIKITQPEDLLIAESYLNAGSSALCE